MDKLEAVARAIHEARSSIPWEVTSQQDLAYRDARAALSAIPDERAAGIREGLEMAAKACDQLGGEWTEKKKRYQDAGNNGPYLGAPCYAQAARIIRALIVEK